MNRKDFIYALFIVRFQSKGRQNAISSVTVNICNVHLSSDMKMLSYDVYLSSTNKNKTVSINEFIFRFIIPQADPKTKARIIFITNPAKELGNCTETITASGTNWMIRFLHENTVLLHDYPGTHISTVNIANADGSTFSDPAVTDLNYSDMEFKCGKSCSVFKYYTTILNGNPTETQPIPIFTGFKDHSHSSTYTLLPNPVINDFWINVGDTIQKMELFDANGKLALSSIINKKATINISSLPNGIYQINVDGTQNKLVKKAFTE